MPSIFSRLKGKDGSRSKAKKKAQLDQLAESLPAKQRWDDAYARKVVEPEEIQELIRRCTEELKARGTFWLQELRYCLLLHHMLIIPLAQMQLLTTRSSSCPSGQHPTRAPSGPSFATFSITPRAYEAKPCFKNSA
jgi:hypothetical protein